jgi:hypothetical protein
VADTIYWSAPYDYEIRGAPLSGGTVETLYDSAQDVNLPMGLAIDPVAGRIYWANYGDSTIRGAPLTAGGSADELYGPADGVSDPFAVAIDPAAGQIYWTNGEWSTAGVAGTIRRAPLHGNGPVVDLYGVAHGVSFPGGLAIDPNPAGVVSGRLELATDRFDLGGWVSGALDRIRDLFARADHFPTTPSPPPRIYWGNGVTTTSFGATNPNDKKVQSAPLAGGGPVDTLYGPANWTSGPSALAVLRAPVGTGPPAISWAIVLPEEFSGGMGGGPGGGLEGGAGGWQFGGGNSGPQGQRLTCSRGSWAPDLSSCFLYRAPQNFAYQWRLNGADIGGANAPQYTATAPGSYTCRVTATNQSGSAAQTSAAFTVS